MGHKHKIAKRGPKKKSKASGRLAMSDRAVKNGIDQVASLLRSINTNLESGITIDVSKVRTCVEYFLKDISARNGALSSYLQDKQREEFRQLILNYLEENELFDRTEEILEDLDYVKNEVTGKGELEVIEDDEMSEEDYGGADNPEDDEEDEDGMFERDFASEDEDSEDDERVRT